MTKKSLVDSLRQLGKYSEFEPNYFFLAADRIEELSEKPIKTNYDRIRNMSVEEITEYIYSHDDELNDKICRKYSECPFGDNVQPSDCKNCVREWLESEVDTE